MSIICVRRISDVRRRILHGNPSAQPVYTAHTTGGDYEKIYPARRVAARSLRPSQRNRSGRLERQH
jgi:hypothetical protein